jgi:hypothetical protein
MHPQHILPHAQWRSTQRSGIFVKNAEFEFNHQKITNNPPEGTFYKIIDKYSSNVVRS